MASPHSSPDSCCERRKAHRDVLYSRRPARRSADYACAGPWRVRLATVRFATPSLGKTVSYAG
ncbi:MAG: hypothetical protein OER87_20865 [Gammaproteobacteria bacterium]|nr:hypothetical protein [Gammaproteobacteria bacterium]